MKIAHIAHHKDVQEFIDTLPKALEIDLSGATLLHSVIAGSKDEITWGEEREHLLYKLAEWWFFEKKRPVVWVCDKVRGRRTVSGKQPGHFLQRYSYNRLAKDPDSMQGIFAENVLVIVKPSIGCPEIVRKWCSSILCNPGAKLVLA